MECGCIYYTILLIPFHVKSTNVLVSQPPFLLTEEPAKFVNKPRAQPQESDALMGDVVLSCEVASSGTTVVWKKDQKEITEDKRTTFVSQGTQRKLIIKGAKQSDEGRYSCETPEDKMTFLVKIKGKASAN